MQIKVIRVDCRFTRSWIIFSRNLANLSPNKAAAWQRRDGPCDPAFISNYYVIRSLWDLSGKFALARTLFGVVEATQWGSRVDLGGRFSLKDRSRVDRQLDSKP